MHVKRFNWFPPIKINQFGDNVIYSHRHICHIYSHTRGVYH